MLIGRVTFGEVAMFLHSQREQDVWSYGVLYDARDATIDLADADLPDLTAHLQTLNQPSARGPVAVVGTDARLRVVVDTFSRLVEPMGLAVRLFTDIPSASRWLDEQPQITTQDARRP